MKVAVLLFGFFYSLTLVGQSDKIYGQDIHKDADFTYDQLLAFVGQNYHDEEDIARFFYYWLASNIAYDYQLAEQLAGSQKVGDLNALQVFERRKAVCSGYASLYKLFLNEFEIECEMVDGIAKNREGLMLSDPMAIYHIWNVINIDNEWHLVDVTWASTMKVEGKVSEFHFKTSPKSFVFNHLPAIPYWQLLEEPVTAAEFVQLPELNADYYKLGFASISPSLTCDETQCKLVLGRSVDWKPIINLSSTGLNYQRVNYKRKYRGDLQELTFPAKTDQEFIIRLDAYQSLDMNTVAVRTQLAYVVVR